MTECNLVLSLVFSWEMVLWFEVMLPKHVLETLSPVPQCGGMGPLGWLSHEGSAHLHGLMRSSRE